MPQKPLFVGEPVVALIPLAYSVLVLLNFVVLIRLTRFTLFRRNQQLFILILPASLQLALGGIVGSSAIVAWSLIAVLMAVLFAERREAMCWFAAFDPLQPHRRCESRFELALCHRYRGTRAICLKREGASDSIVV